MPQMDMSAVTKLLFVYLVYSFDLCHVRLDPSKATDWRLLEQF